MNHKCLKICVDAWWYVWETGTYVLINIHFPEVGFLISPQETTSEISTGILLLICENKWCDPFQCEMDLEKWVRGIYYFFVVFYLFCGHVAHVHIPKIGEIGFSLRMGRIPTSRGNSVVKALCVVIQVFHSF